ncbi:phage tail tape measure protein [Bacteroides stercoris]|jgi:TP901 family phage tail tape measure protein|uniref:Phage tail tape measure protein n=2 Tax=Pseudomonadati TaxID=3379134 RepID=A0A414Q7X1_BACSE|nr:phage tail tape measure protein [Bacteroides stercoris]RHF76895.1 phage tail tape measure protein [Bacteroides stercoris]DAL37493.1 MAG TPA_asm: minor tail protein [Bacteriophage sp.]
MANEFVITDVVSDKALNQLTSLTNKFTEVKKAYAELGKELAKSYSIPVSNYDDLTNKARLFEEIQKKLITTEKELANIQNEYKALLKNIAEETQKATKEALEQAKANDLNAQAELKAAKVETERLKQQKMLNQEKKKLKITTQEAIALTNKEVHSINEAKEQNKLLRIAVSQVTDAEDKDNKVRQQLNNQIAKNTEYIRRNTDSYTKQKMAIGAYKNEIKAAIVELQNGNKTFKNLGIVAKGYGNILRSNVAGGLNEVRIGVGSMVKGMVGAQAVISGFQKLIGLFKSGAQSIVDFEAANSKLAAILGTTSKNIKDLTTDAQRLGAATKYTASQATALQIELAKLGFSKNEILQSTEGILKFAQATGAELPEAAALAGAALRMFNADTSETERYVSAMAVATTKSALSFSYLQTAMPIVGPVAKAFNFQIEDTLALLGKLADSGFDASMAATALRNIFLNLADSNGLLAKSLGGAVKTLPELVNGLKKLKEQGVDLNTTLELTDKRSVAQFNTLLTNIDALIPLREQITGVEEELGNMANTMGDNVQGAILGLSSAWEAFMLSFKKSTGPAKNVIDFFARGIRNVANQLKDANQLQDDYNNRAVAMAQNEMAKSNILEKNARNMQNLYQEYVQSGMKADEAAIKAKEEYIETLKSRLEFENTDYQLAIANRNKLEDELKNRGFFTILTSWKRTNSVIKEEIDVATKAAAGKKAISSITESLINQLNKIDLAGSNASDAGNNGILTDKEKKALEKAAKERIRIREALQQSELDLMDEGLEKELAKISLNYNKRIAAIRGSSKEEQATRENLAKAMQEALEDKQLSYGLDKEKSQIEHKLDIVKKGSEEEYRLRLELLDNEREQAINAAIKNGEDVFLVDEKYKRKRLDLEERYASEKNKKIQESYSFQSVIINAAMSKELDEAAAQYSQGLINKEDYERKKQEITEKYAIKQAQLAIDLAKEQLNTPGLSEEDRLKLKEKIAQAEIALAEKVRDAEINAVDKSAEANKRKMDKIAETIQAISDLLGGFADLGTAIFERKMEEVEAEQDANDEAYDREVERIEKLEENGAISTEEAEARKRAAEDKTAKKNAELEKKKAALQEKQAKFDKANNIIQTIMATSLAIMKAWTNPFAAPGIIPLIIAQGAVSLATIIAQPIPKYAKGTKDHPGGLAIVGDGGKKEGIVTNNGLFITPDKPTLVDLPAHAQVIPDLSYIYDRRGLTSDYGLLEQKLKNMREEGIVVNVNNDYSRLERKMESNTKQLQNIGRIMKKANHIADYNWISSRV